jgi:hypothetical protein
MRSSRRAGVPSPTPLARGRKLADLAKLVYSLQTAETDPEKVAEACILRAGDRTCCFNQVLTL